MKIKYSNTKKTTKFKYYNYKIIFNSKINK